MNIFTKLKNTAINTVSSIFINALNKENYGLFEPDFDEIEKAEQDFKNNPFAELAFNNYRGIRTTQAADSGLLGLSTRSHATQLYRFRDMELCFLDAKVQSCYDRLLNEIFQHDFNIISANDETPEAIELKEFIEHVNSEMEESIETVLKESLKVGMHFGYSPSEIVFKISDSNDFDGKRIIRAIKSKRPGLFALEGDDYDNLLGIKALGDLDHIVIPKEKFLLYSHNKLFSNYYGTPKFDTIHKHWKAKQKCMEQWEIYNDRTSHPIPWVEYSEESLEDKAFEIAENMYSGSYFAVPAGVSAKFVEVARMGSDPFDVFLDFCDEQINIAICGPELSKGAGSHAADKVKQQEKNIYSKELRKVCEKIYFEQIIKPLCTENFLKSDYQVKYYPRGKFSEVMQVNQNDFMVNVEKACDLGFINVNNPIHINFVNKTMGYPLISDKELEKRLQEGIPPPPRKTDNKKSPSQDDSNEQENYAYDFE